jgi:hypothetical protein
MHGWRALATLRPGDRIAAARTLPALGGAHWPRHRLVVLAGLLTEGNLCHPSTFYFSTSDSRHCREFVAAVERFPNTRATVARHRDCFSVHVRRAVPAGPIGAVMWARALGLWARGARDKRLPAEVFELHSPDIAFLLSRLWDGDGSVSRSRHVSYDTVSRDLADGVQHLLLRLGIVSRVYRRTRGYRGRQVTSYVVTVTGHDNLRVFWQRIGRHFLNERRRASARVLATATCRGRASRDIIPIAVRSIIKYERVHRRLTWDQLAAATRLSMGAVSSPSIAKGGYRRDVIARLGRYFDSPELLRLGTSDVYWDRVLGVEAIGERETYDLEIEGDHNFLANDLVVHNSHSSSFALLAYASAYLKAHHGPAFYAALLNNQPMGFYHASTVVNDARRHGVRVLPIDVTRSDWPCTLERRDGGWAVRLGLRYVKGLRERAGRALVDARAERPFTSTRDLAARAGLVRDELETLASIGALAPLGGTRRTNLWNAAAADLGPLFAGAPDDATVSPLREMTHTERLVADYGGTGVTLGRHPMALRRAALAGRGVRRAAELPAGRDGERVRVAGSVIVRQRPGTAKGFVFLSLEDETGIANVIVTPRLFTRARGTLVTEPFLLVEGILQIQDDVVSVRARRVEPLARLAHAVPSHDFG